jgi:hypothetical protein
MRLMSVPDTCPSLGHKNGRHGLLSPNFFLSALDSVVAQVRVKTQGGA